MSLAITHFLAGTIIALYVSALFNFELSWRLSIVILGGTWAMIPDLNKIHPAFDWLHASVWSNIFMLHGFFDRADTNDSIIIPILLLFTLIVLALFIELMLYDI